MKSRTWIKHDGNSLQVLNSSEPCEVIDPGWEPVPDPWYFRLWRWITRS